MIFEDIRHFPAFLELLMAKSHGPWLGASPEPSRALLDGLMKVVHLEALCDWGNPKWRLFVREHPIKIDDEMGYPHLWKPLYCTYDIHLEGA